jgi:hypothetical protein
MEFDAIKSPIIFTELSTAQLKALHIELDELYDDIENPPLWVTKKFASVPSNRNNTGSKICDLLI